MIKDTQSLFYVDMVLPTAVLLMKLQFKEFEQVDSSRRIAPPPSTNYAFKIILLLGTLSYLGYY